MAAPTSGSECVATDQDHHYVQFVSRNASAVNISPPVCQCRYQLINGADPAHQGFSIWKTRDDDGAAVVSRFSPS
jgi:hypothetical protein